MLKYYIEFCFYMSLISICTWGALTCNDILIKISFIINIFVFSIRLICLEVPDYDEQ